MNPTEATITVAIITAVTSIVASIVGLIGTRTGTVEKLRRVEYLIKRTELIEKFLSLQYNQIEKDKIPVSLLIDELIDISASIHNSSIRQQHQDQLDFDKRILWKRIFTLPVPSTVGGWIGSGIFYMYSLSSLIYFGMLVVVLRVDKSTEAPPGPQDLPISAILGGLLVSALFAWGGRVWAVKSARNAAILKSAHGEIANRSVQAMDKSLAP